MNTIRCLRSYILVSAVAALAACAQPASVAPIPSNVAGITSHVSAATTPRFHAFTAGNRSGFPVTAVPRDLAIDSSGTVWFADINTPAIGRITGGAKFHEFTSGLQSGARPYSLLLGPDGNVWFSDCAGAIGRVTSSGTITEFRTPHAPNAAPLGITVGSDGALWGVAVGPPEGKSFLIRVTLAGSVSSFLIPPALIPDGSIQADDSGNLWFFASLVNHDVVLVRRTSKGRFISHATGLVTKGEPCCPNLAPKHMVLGPDANPWFTTPYFGLPNNFAKVVGTYASGRATFFDAATERIGYPVYPSGIASTRKFLWFGGSDPIGTNGAIWRMTLSGAQRAYPIPYNPSALAASSDKSLWFVSQVQGRVPQIVEATW
jgi:hypothetical protein